MFSKVQLRLQFLVLLWGFTGLFGKLVTISALPMVWYRMLIAAFAIFLYLRFKKKSCFVSKKHLFQLLGIGGIVALHWFTFYLSIKVSNVAIALSTLSLGALFSSIIEPVLYRRKVVLSEIILALIVSGCVVWIFQASPQYKLGIIYGAICSFLSALFSVLNSKLKDEVTSTSITLYEMIGGFITVNLLLLCFQLDGFYEIINVGWSNFLWLTLLAVIFTAFALAVGFSCLVTYSSYLKKDVSLPNSAGSVVGLSIFVSFLAGLAIFPVVFAFDLEVSSGPPLLFMVLPAAFSQMPFGEIFLALFLILFLFATLTSSFSMYEIIVAAVIEKWNISRTIITVIIGVLVFIASIPSALTYSSLGDVSIFGRNIFDFTDFVVSNVILPIGNLLIAIFIMHVMDKQFVKTELLQGSKMGEGFYKTYRFLMTFVVPTVIVVVLGYLVFQY